MATLTRDFREKATAYFSGKQEAFATTLLVALIKMYGLEVLDWDPLTIQLEVKDDLGLEMPRKVFDRVMALISALKTDAVYKDVPLFDETVNALAGDGVGVERGVPSVEDVAWAVAELEMADPEPITRDSNNPFSRSVAKYVRVVLDDEGMYRAPKILSFAASRPIRKEGMDDKGYYAAAWGNADAKADEIDTWVEDRVVTLLNQLMELGVVFTPEQSKETLETVKS